MHRRVKIRETCPAGLGGNMPCRIRKRETYFE